MNFMTIKQFVSKYTFFSAPSLRWLIRRDKGFRQQCVRKVLGKLFIIEAEVLKFIDNCKMD